MVYWGYILSWYGLLVLAVFNGTLREKVYGPRMDDKLRAHQISTILFLILFSLYMVWLAMLWQIETPEQAFQIGVSWLGLTVVFEFGFMHFVLRRPWKVLFADYRLKDGRIWVLVLVWLVAAPYISFLATRSSPGFSIRSQYWIQQTALSLRSRR